MKVANCVQGTQDWFDVRNGRVTASRINDVMQYLKSGKEGQRRIDYKTELIAELLRGESLPHYVSPQMLWGIEQEALAATEYELASPLDVNAVGFVFHPSIERAGSSPDRIVGSDGLLEIKCPDTTTHIEWILGGVVPEQHRNQMYFQMRCCERDWCDFLSFDSRLPKRYQKFMARLHADEQRMEEIDAEVLKFLAEVDEVVARLDAAAPDVPREVQAPLEKGLTEEDLNMLP